MKRLIFNESTISLEEEENEVSHVIMVRHMNAENYAYFLASDWSTRRK
jgi:hypothetical protein